MGGKEGGVDAGVLLGGVGVEFPAHILHATEDVVGLTPPGTLEDDVLDEMGYAGLVRLLVAAAGVDDEGTVGGLGGDAEVDEA